MRTRFVLPIMLVAAVVSVSTAAIFIKLCDDADPAAIAAARLSIAAIVLTPVAAAVHGPKLVVIPPEARGAILLAGLFLAAHFYFWISSLKHTSVVSSVVIATTNPIFVGLASYLLFKESVGRRLVYGIVLATVGGGVIALADAGHAQAGSLRGDVLSLIGAVMASCYLLTGRRVRRDVDTISYILPVYAVAAVVLCGVTLVRGLSFVGYRPSTYLYFVLLALVPQVIGHSTFNYALRRLTATLVAVCILGEPIGASLLAFVFLDEKVGAVQLVGGALILSGVFLAAAAQFGQAAEERPSLGRG